MPPDAPTPELKILRPKDEAIDDENDWPQLLLNNTEVRAKNGRLISLLYANQGSPVTVTGELVLRSKAKDDVNHVKHAQAALIPGPKSRVATIPIILKSCTYFAYGEMTDGRAVIWAAGAAGWYKILPADTYQDIYKEMYEAIEALHFLIDCYGSEKRISYDDIFKRYAKKHKTTPREAAEWFYAHAASLATLMKPEGSIKWGHTSFYQHLRKARPEAFGALAKPSPPPTIAPTITRTTAVRSQARDTKSRSQSEDTRQVQAPPRRGRPPKVTKAEPTVTKAEAPPRKASVALAPLLSEVNKAKAKEIWKFMQKKTNDTLPEIEDMTTETFGRFMFQEYDFEDQETARRVLLYLAADLVAMMSVPRGRSYDPWTELPIYDELLVAKLPPRIRGKIAALILVRREKPLYDASDTTETSDANSDEESIMDESEAKIRRQQEEAHRSLSALRPKSSSKFSGKAAKRKGKGKLVEEDDVEMIVDDEDVMSIDTPSKRKGMSDEDEIEEEEYPNKRFTRSQGHQDPELRDLEFEVQQARSTGLAIRRKASQSLPPLTANAPPPQTRLALVSKPVESLDANAPGDIWNCPEVGCVHKVYGASEGDSKELIREHLLDHKEGERVDVLRSEESMTRLPVSNLLKRIREMAERNGGEVLREMGDGFVGLFPKPLERALV